MASKAALAAGTRLWKARDAVIKAIHPLGDGVLPAWRTIKAMERAAIKVGEIRERGRRAPGGGRK